MTENISPISILCIGNELRGDDGVGLRVAKKLRERNMDGVKIIESTGEAASLIDHFKSSKAVLIIDSARTGKTAGTIQRFQLPGDQFPVSSFSSHDFGVAEATELARALGVLPSFFVVFLIEGKNFDRGSELSKPVQESVELAEKMILAELRNTFQLREP